MIKIGGLIYKKAEEPLEGEEISSEEMVQEMKTESGENWEEYLQPIIISIRSQFGLEEGTVSLINPTVKDQFGASAYGFSIIGHVDFGDPVPHKVMNKYGDAPYKFLATISSDGELISAVEISGSEG